MGRTIAATYQYSFGILGVLPGRLGGGGDRIRNQKGVLVCKDLRIGTSDRPYRSQFMRLMFGYRRAVSIETFRPRESLGAEEICKPEEP